MNTSLLKQRTSILSAFRCIVSGSVGHVPDKITNVSGQFCRQAAGFACLKSSCGFSECT